MGLREDLRALLARVRTVAYGDMILADDHNLTRQMWQMLLDRWNEVKGVTLDEVMEAFAPMWDALDFEKWKYRNVWVWLEGSYDEFRLNEYLYMRGQKKELNAWVAHRYLGFGTYTFRQISYNWGGRYPEGMYRYTHFGLSDYKKKNGVFVEQGTYGVILETMKDGATTRSPDVADVRADEWHTYEFRWSKDKVELWIDGELKVTNTTNIPQIELLEWYHGVSWATDGYQYEQEGTRI